MIIDCPDCKIVQSAPAPSCPLKVGTHQLGVMLPCASSVATLNQPALIDIGIADKDASVTGVVPIQVQAPGMLNVEVWTHGKMGVRLTDAGNGEFVGTLDLSKEPAGPLHVRFMAWDVGPGAQAKTTLVGEYTLFVGGVRASISNPPAALGRSLVFSDDFTSLDTKKWYQNLYNGQDFGDCANEHSMGKFNPFTILPNGVLRIRNTFDPSYVDPYGFNRHQYCGVLSSAFKDGTNSLSMKGDGYFDARVLVPNGELLGGTWPSFWMLGTNGGAGGGIELDMMEMYGNDATYFQGFTHAYPPAVFPAPGGGGYSGHPSGDLTWDWHTVGMLVTGSGTPAGKVCNYLDEVQLACSPMPQYGSPEAATKPAWALMIELASGGGWPSEPPPSGHFDFFVDWVGVWQ